MKTEMKVQTDQIEKLNKEIKLQTEKQKTQSEKTKKEQQYQVKSLESVIEELQSQLKKKDEEKNVLLEQKDQNKESDDKNLSKQSRIKALLSESLDQLSLVAEQICFKSKVDRIECAETLFMAINGSCEDKAFEGLDLFV